MKDIEVLADRVCFIHNGVKKAEGALSSFRKVREFAHLSFAEPLRSVPEFITPLRVNEYQVPLERLGEALALARVERVTTVEETLEDYFIALTREAGGAGGGDESRMA
jgi:ABC-type multidrug transport system ATPase subunit